MSARISGQGWARFGLGFGAALSVIGNVAHTYLIDSTVSLLLRVPFAVAWPVVLFIGIEVLVRVDWRQKFLDHAGRVLIWGPAGAVAAVVSYLHLHQLMTFAGETWFAALVGPLAIDGLMIGCTVALLAIRAASLAEKLPALQPQTELSDKQLEQILERWAPEQEEIQSWTPEHGEQLAEQVEQTQETMSTPRPTRTRPAKAEHEKAVRMLLDGSESSDVVTATGIGASTLRRYKHVAGILKNDPLAEIGPEKKVAPELVAIIRDAMNRERAL